MLEYIKSKIPVPVKRAVRQTVCDPLKRKIDDWQLHCSINNLRASSTTERKLLKALHRAWGNESFSADLTYITELASRVEKCSSPILECGSGVTTIVAGVLAERRNLAVWTLEQDSQWVQFVTHRLTGNKIQNVRLIHAALREYDGYVWYDIDKVELPPHFELVLCDGPAVFESWGPAHIQGRYGLLPLLASKGISVGEVLLDDATTPSAASVLERWQQEFGTNHHLVHTSEGDYAVVSRHD